MGGFSASGREESRKEVVANSVIEYQERPEGQGVNHYAHTTSTPQTSPNVRGEVVRRCAAGRSSSGAPVRPAHPARPRVALASVASA